MCRPILRLSVVMFLLKELLVFKIFLSCKTNKVLDGTECHWQLVTCVYNIASNQEKPQADEAVGCASCAQGDQCRCVGEKGNRVKGFGNVL